MYFSLNQFLVTGETQLKLLSGIFGFQLTATVFGDRLLLLNSFTSCIDTSGLFLNIKNENFGQNLDLKFLPQPPSEGGTKNDFFYKLFVEPKC